MDAPPSYPAVSQGQPPQQPSHKAQPMQQTGQYAQPMPPNGQYAVPANTNSTVSIKANLKSINPLGKCCFLFPLKIGTIAIAILTAAFSVSSIFFIFSGTLNTVGNAIMAIICLIGAYWIYAGSYRLLPIYAAVYTIITSISIALTIFIAAIIPCTSTDYACTSQKTRWISATVAVAIIRLYFVYVTIDYTIKLRKEATMMLGVKSGAFHG